MVAVFELAWLAFWFVCLAILVPLSASIKESRETTKPGISNDGGVSNGRCVDDEDDAAAAAARGAGCSGNILATNMDSQLKGLSLKAAESHLFKPTTTPGDPQDNLPVPLRTPEASLLLPYSDRLSITSSTVLSILSRMHSKTRTKTKTKTMMKTKATSTSESTSTLSTLDQQHDLQAFVDSSRSGSLFASSAVRAF
ncbi:hypothetical protein BKA64DRAFT_668265 [Cadophora sp. MPI-SDFR-AT-0126]|nr:hypothetical protein BKA64DRAFT_668265 [Leotiomycetes sp. MPI-SDFR-AT-0126]